MKAFRTTVATDLATARQRLEAALKEQGFGVLTEVDVQATFKAKLDVELGSSISTSAAGCSRPTSTRPRGGAAWAGSAPSSGWRWCATGPRSCPSRGYGSAARLSLIHI